MSERLARKLGDGELLILDGAMGTELERLGAPMDEGAWCAVALRDHPGLVHQVHRQYINAGAEVITTNTYATTQASLRRGGYESHFNEWNRQAVELARRARDETDTTREVFIAGSVSTFGSFGEIDDNTLAPQFSRQAEVLAEAGVDLLLLETLAARTSTILTLVEATRDFGLPVWLAISCVHDRARDRYCLGIEESQEHSDHHKVYEPLSEALPSMTDLPIDALLIMHTDLKATRPALQMLATHYSGPKGVYPNAGYWLRPKWAFVDQISPGDYLNHAREWVEEGALIVGGCCGIGPEHIGALRDGLKNPEDTTA